MAGRRRRGRLCRSWCSLTCAAWCLGALGGSARCKGVLRRPDGRPATPGTAVQELVLPGVRCLVPRGTGRQCLVRCVGLMAGRRRRERQCRSWCSLACAAWCLGAPAAAPDAKARCVGLMAGRRRRGRLCRSWCSLACAAWCHGALGGSRRMRRRAASA